jgi:hypothetical protein
VGSGFNINIHCRGKFALEDTEGGSRVHVGARSEERRDGKQGPST